MYVYIYIYILGRREAPRELVGQAEDAADPQGDRRPAIPVLGKDTTNNVYVYIYIYIYRERER